MISSPTFFCHASSSTTDNGNDSHQVFQYPLLYPISCVLLFLMFIWISGVGEIFLNRVFVSKLRVWNGCIVFFHSCLDRGLVGMAVASCSVLYVLLFSVYFCIHVCFSLDSPSCTVSRPCHDLSILSIHSASSADLAAFTVILSIFLLAPAILGCEYREVICWTVLLRRRW